MNKPKLNRVRTMRWNEVKALAQERYRDPFKVWQVMRDYLRSYPDELNSLHLLLGIGLYPKFPEAYRGLKSDVPSVVPV